MSDTDGRVLYRVRFPGRPPRWTDDYAVAYELATGEKLPNPDPTIDDVRRWRDDRVEADITIMYPKDTNDATE